MARPESWSKPNWNFIWKKWRQLWLRNPLQLPDYRTELKKCVPRSHQRTVRDLSYPVAADVLKSLKARASTQKLICIFFSVCCLSHHISLSLVMVNCLFEQIGGACFYSRHMEFYDFSHLFPPPYYVSALAQYMNIWFVTCLNTHCR